jgi:hypothetical protein
MLLTGISIGALVSPPLKKRAGFNWYIVVVIAIFMAINYVNFTMG